jgi:hypothetical protein
MRSLPFIIYISSSPWVFDIHILGAIAKKLEDEINHPESEYYKKML